MSFSLLISNPITFILCKKVTSFSYISRVTEFKKKTFTNIFLKYNKGLLYDTEPHITFIFMVCHNLPNYVS